MMDLRTSDGVDFYCLPDCAKCKLTGKSPLEMIECPIKAFDDFGDVCNPDLCEHYEEAW